MSTIDPKVEHCVQIYKDMDAKRAPFNADWQDIRTFVRPITVQFNPITGQFQTVRTDLMFDGTAPDALEQLGSALHSMITNPADRWFEIVVEGDVEIMSDPSVLDWCDKVSEIIYSEYRRETSSFNLAIHEAYLDVGSFGTTCLYQSWDSDTSGLLFQAKPLPYCYFKENSKGRVDTVYIKHDWTLRQIKQEFGQVLPPKLMEVKNEEQSFEIIHAVYPRTDRIKGSMLPKNKAFASIWFCLNTKELLSESGYDSLPYSVARWTKLTSEVYGRSPAKKCLPDIKMLNAMERTVLKAGQKQVDPPLVLAHEGFMLPIRTSPGALIFKEEEERKIEPLLFQGNLPWAEEKANQKREFINKCFYGDLIRRNQKKAEQTATEVTDERDEMLMLMAPILGRLTSELHGPMIARSYDLLNQHNRIPKAPEAMAGKKLAIGYMGVAARAQKSSKAMNIGRFINDLLPLSQVDPGILDAVDMDAVADEYAKARGVPRVVIRSPEAVAQIREQKGKMQAAQQMAQVAEPASKALKNVSDATGGQIPGL